jgi:hypothetical protein
MLRLIDRFTRDEFSAKVWWPFTMVILVVFVLTFPAEHRAVDARHRDTAAIDAALTQRVIGPDLVSDSASSSITGPLSTSLTEEVGDEILVNDARIVAVRIWSSSHVLAWSSLSNDDLGSDLALNDGDIDAAVAAGGAPTWLTTHRTPTNEPGPATFYSYTSIAGQPLIASFEYRDGALTSDVRARWLGYQIVIGLGLLLALIFSLLSMQEPLAEIGTGVPFFPGSVPQDLTLMEVDRAVAIEQAGDRIKERIASLQHKLEASEAARLRAEGRLQQALAALAQPGRRSRMPVPEPTPVAREVVKVPEPEPIVAQAEPKPEPIVAQAEPKPEPIVAQAEPTPEAVVAQAEPTPEAVVVARAKPTPGPKGRSLVVQKKQRAPGRTPKPRPVAAPAPKPSAPRPDTETPQPEPAVETPQPEPAVETPQPEPAPIVPPPEPAPIVPPPDPITTPEPEAEPVPKGEPSDASGSPEVVVVPDLQPARTSTGPESAPDLLDRLVEPVDEHGPTDAVDDLRAKLARTAALKKPGSKERRKPDEQHGS